MSDPARAMLDMDGALGPKMGDTLGLALQVAPAIAQLVQICAADPERLVPVVALWEAAVRQKARRDKHSATGGAQCEDIILAARIAPQVAPLLRRCLSGETSASAIAGILTSGGPCRERAPMGPSSATTAALAEFHSPPEPALAPPPRGGHFKWAPGEADRAALHPIRHQDIWALYKQLEGLNWTAQQIGLERDKADWKRMTPDQRHFVKMQLAFFARVDIDVLENLGANFSEEVDCLEARFFFAAQEAQECVHAEAYGLQILAVIEGAEQAEVLNAVRTMPVIRAMHAWVRRWFDRALPVEERLVAWAAVEGVLFSSSFSALQWLKTLNLLPGITGYNTYISRDEGLHTIHLSLLVRRYLVNPPPAARAYDIFVGLVELLDTFVAEALPVRLVGMNDELMRQYVRFQADCVLAEMGYAPRFQVANPFRFMESMLLNDTLKTNFYEEHNSSYQSVTREGAALLAVDDSPVEY